MLVKCGADVNGISDYESLPVLCVCAFLGHCDLLTLLLNHGANMNKTDCNLGRSALACACIRGHRDVCEILLKGGCSTLTTDVYGLTPVEHAASGGFLDVVKLLINSSTTSSIERSLVLSAYNGYKHVSLLTSIHRYCNNGLSSSYLYSFPFTYHATFPPFLALSYLPSPSPAIPLPLF